MLLRVMGEIEKKEKDIKAVPADELLDSLAAYHGKTGAVLLKRWNFPGVYLQVAELHDHIDGIQTPSKELLVVHLANVLVKSMGYGTPNPEGIDPETLTSLKALEIDPAELGSIKEQVKVRMEELKSYLE